MPRQDNIKSEIEELRKRIMDHETRLSKVEGSIDSINDKIDFIVQMLQSMNNKIDGIYKFRNANSNNKKIDMLMRWNIVLWIIVLSFLAAVLGVAWHPP